MGDAEQTKPGSSLSHFGHAGTRTSFITASKDIAS
jgi:hypothetical protein